MDNVITIIIIENLQNRSNDTIFAIEIVFIMGYVYIVY